MERFELEISAGWRHYGEKKLAPLCRKNTGSITPEIQWLLYAENKLAPLRRKLTARDHDHPAMLSAQNRLCAESYVLAGSAGAPPVLSSETAAVDSKISYMQGVYAGIPDFSARLEGVAPTVVSLGVIRS